MIRERGLFQVTVSIAADSWHQKFERADVRRRLAFACPSR
jgi:hypothetical protein